MKKIEKRGERLLLDPGLMYFRGTPFRMRDCSPRGFRSYLYPSIYLSENEMYKFKKYQTFVERQ